MADLTIVINTRLKKIWFLTSGLSRSLKVIGTDTDRSSICDFQFVFYRNFVPKTHRFWDYRLQKCCELEIQVRGPSRSLDTTPFNRAHVTRYWCSIYLWLYLVSFLRYSMSKNVGTLKSESEVTQGHGKLYHSIEWVQFSISVLFNSNFVLKTHRYWYTTSKMLWPWKPS